MAANISTETYSILHDSLGEDVRDSLCEACQKIAPELLPVVTAEDAGKVMGVNQYGQWAAARYIPYWRLQYITITTQPTKTSYFVGDQLDLTGVVVTAHYGSDFEPDKTEVVTSRCNFSPVDGSVLTYDTQSVHVEFSDGGVTATASIHLDVSLVLPVSIAVTTMPTKTQYDSGDQLDLTGIVVTATYNNGTTAVVTSSCTFNPDDGDMLTGNSKSVTVSYESLGQIVTTSFAISVTPALNYTRVITKPTKLAYAQGEILDLSGIVVRAYYDDGSSEIVTSDCVFSPADGTVLNTVGDQAVSVSFTDNGKTVTTSFNVQVAVLALTGISVTTMPARIGYIVGETLDFSGIIVSAIYNNGTTDSITSECTFSPAEGTTLSELGTKTVDIYYTEDGVTYTTSFSVDVSTFKVKFIRVFQPNKLTYFVGEYLDLTGIEVQAEYTDYTSTKVTSDCVFSPADGTFLQEPGKLPITATYTDPKTGEVFTESSTPVWVLILDWIMISSINAKRFYQVGEALDLSGLDVVGEYTTDPGSEGTVGIDVTERCVFTPPDGTILSEPGTQDINISITDTGVTKTTTFRVVVS